MLRAHAGPLKIRRDALEWREFEGEVIVLDVEASEYLSANPSGARLWQALAAGTTRDELVEMLVDAYEIDEADAAADVDRFLDVLRGRGLLDG